VKAIQKIARIGKTGVASERTVWMTVNAATHKRIDVS
jgi:hypothetical protein